MRRTKSETYLTRKWAAEASTRGPDHLIVEEPLTIQLDGVVVSTTMRTPGHDFELAVGFCHAEGVLDGHPVIECRYCAAESALASAFNVVTVSTGGRAPEPQPRLGVTSSSCGLCGSEAIMALVEQLPPIDVEPFAAGVLASIPDLVRSKQPLFDQTGAVHAAAAVTRAGELVVVREDIGRHNAVDKVVGRLLFDGQLPAGDLALFVSGRASFEMVQKAWAAGFGSVVAVSAPSALAVDTARSAKLCLAGFARNGTLNIYSPE